MQVHIEDTINLFRNGCTIDQDSLSHTARNVSPRLNKNKILASPLLAKENLFLKAIAAILNHTEYNLVKLMPCHRAAA